LIISPLTSQQGLHFLAQVHRASGVEEWLTRVIRERIELEEVAFAEAKRDLRRTQEV